MKKNYCLAIFSTLLIWGCSSADYGKIRVEENEKLAKKEVESQEILKKYGNSLSLQEAIEIGEERNSNLKISRIQKEIAKLDRDIAFGNFLPKITAGGSYNQFNDGIYAKTVGVDLPFSMELETRIVDKNFYAGGVSATLPIFTPTAWYLYEARKKGMDISGEIEEFQRKKMRVEIINAYYHVAALESERSYLGKEIERARELTKNSKAALETESLMEWEFEQSQQFLKSREYALNKNSRELSEAKMQLLKLLDLHPMVGVEIENKENFQEKDLELERIIESSLINNSLLKIEDISHGIGEDKVKMAVAAFLPNIAVTGGYSRNNNSAIVDPTVINGSLMGAVSLFNGFQNINSYRKSKKELEISEIKREDAAAKIILESVNAFNLYEEIRENLELAEKNYSIAKKKLRQRELEREAEMINEEELLQTYAEYERAFSLKKNCEYKYQIVLAVIEMITGGNDDGAK